MPIPPVPPDHAENRRDDGHTDFAKLKKGGLVRTKRSDQVIHIGRPHTDFSALQRDRLFQAYCAMMRANPSPEHVRQWIAREAAKIVGEKTGRAMSLSRAMRIIGQGCGEWDSDNSVWWRGVSVGEI